MLVELKKLNHLWAALASSEPASQPLKFMLTARSVLLEEKDEGIVNESPMIYVRGINYLQVLHFSWRVRSHLKADICCLTLHSAHSNNGRQWASLKKNLKQQKSDIR